MEFDPTPRLKSSHEPIRFIPFNNNDDRCGHCMTPYSKTRFYDQKYCGNCMFWYIKTAGNDILDVFIVPVESKVFFTHGIKDWQEGSSEVLYFRQVSPGQNRETTSPYRELACWLCGRYYQQPSYSDAAFFLCSECYQISYGWADSIQTYPTLSLPWWDTSIKCNVCQSDCINSPCQKLCLTCRTTYIGCRYCLTTNIIFGLTNQSQCKKCKRVTQFTDVGIDGGNACVDESLNINNEENFRQIESFVHHIHKDSNLFVSVYKFLNNNIRYTPTIRWIQFSEITNLVRFAEGGFGMMYRAIWTNRMVAVKRFRDPYQFTNSFLDKLKTIQLCAFEVNVMKCLGITQDPQTREHMLIMEYARDGNLHEYLKSSFANIKWLKKIHFIWEISKGLNSAHKNNFVHKDLHSGNIVMSSALECRISDLGLISQPATSFSFKEIYGVMPYIAPEIFKGDTFSKESDIYSMGMIMWEFTTGCKPFANVKHDAGLINRIVDGERPEITFDTPECFANLMKRCWDSNPAIRPSSKDICNSCYDWLVDERDFDQFDQAEKKRAAMVLTSPVFTRGSHPDAIYTSRPLSSLICNSSIFRINQERHCRSIQEIETENQTQPSCSSSNTLNVPENNQDISRRHSQPQPSCSSPNTLNVPENNQDKSKKRSVEGLEVQQPTKKPIKKPIKVARINNKKGKKVVVDDGDGNDNDANFSDDYYSSEDERLLAEELKRKYKRSGGDNTSV